MRSGVKLPACTGAPEPSFCHLFQVGAQGRHDLFKVGLSLLHGDVLGAEMFPKMAFQHFCHQAVYRPADRGNLLQDGRAFCPVFKRFLQCFGLTLDASNAR